MPSTPHSGIAYQPPGTTTIAYLPLEEVRLKAWVVDVSSRIVLIQTFYNPSNEPTERAKYVFPLPASAAACAFCLELQDGSVIIGEVKEKEQASREFARAAEQGRAAALVEHVTDDIFTISVGSIPPTTRVTAHLTFVMDLLDEGLTDHVRLQLPVYVAERYGTPPVAMQDASHADPHTRLHITVDVQTSEVIHDIRSPTHNPISLRRYKGRSDQVSQRRMSAVWKSSEFLTSDFVIMIHAEGLDKPRCFAEVLESERDIDGRASTIAMQLTLVPKRLTPKIPSQEYIFIIDRSGSMQGGSIETAKRTLTMLLRLLPTKETTFNVFGFGSNVVRLWQSSRPLDITALSDAISHVDSMGADLGGTEIPNALQTAFNSRGLDRPAVVFLLTDGGIYGAEEQLYAWLSSTVRNSPPAAPTRLFVLGIGTQVSDSVCSSLAQHGKGECLFADSPEYIRGKCARLLNAGRSKNIESIEIDWGCDTSALPLGSSTLATPNLPPGIPTLAPPPPIQQAPSPRSLMNFFSGIRFTVFAITTSNSVPTSIRLITKVEGSTEPHEKSVRVTRVKPLRNVLADSFVPMVHVLAARKLVMELNSGAAPLPSPSPAEALMASEDDLRKAGIIRLGLTYQLVSKYTSFVAVQQGNEQGRVRGRGSGSLAWARSRFQRTQTDPPDSTVETPSILDDLISGVSSLLGAVLGFFGGSVASTRRMDPAPSSQSHRQRLPGTYAGSDSGSDESSSRGRQRSTRRSFPGPTAQSRSPSNTSARTFSTLSSLEGSSSCSSCWTSSRPPTPPIQSVDPLARTPSPDYRRDPHNPLAVPSQTRAPRPVPPQVDRLIDHMEIDGSFKASPLVTQIVGNAVLAKADELGIERTVWTTVVVVAYMMAHLQDEPYLLELVSEKAREYVATVTGSGGDFDEMLRKARTYFGE